jgi:hypothetical protein
VRATAWHNGGPPTDAAGYGIKFTKIDRDQYFEKGWTEVVVELDGIQANLTVTPSFWRTCSELRSAEIGRWLLNNGGAPWHRGQPPGIVVEPVDGNRFTARLLKKHSLL